MLPVFEFDTKRTALDNDCRHLWSDRRSHLWMPLSFPNEVINALKAHENEQRVILCESKPVEPFRSEQKIRVIDGSMRELEGIFQSMSGED